MTASPYLSDDALFAALIHFAYGSNPIGTGILDIKNIVKFFTSTQQRAPTDPNDIVGRAGIGTGGYILPQTSLPYIINFENKPNADAWAAEVVVTHQLDADLDLDTFELGSVGFGDITVEVPAGRQTYATRLDLRSTRGVFVDVDANLNRANRTVTWTLRAIDPTTLDLPIDPFLGLLPPNQSSPEGQGYVTYSIQPKSNLVSGTRIEAQASIVFDVNEPIATNVWLNTIDDGLPSSQVSPLPATSPASFQVSWDGVDDASGPTGSGIASFDIFVSDDGGPFVLWQDNTTDTSATFTGQANHTYSFYSLAIDNTGNIELPKTIADTTTTVEGTVPVANKDDYVAVENVPLVILPSAGVLANDVGGPLRAVLVKTAAHGTLVLRDDGSFEYTPDENFNREDSFQYQASSSVSASATTTVTINVATAYPWYNSVDPVNVNDDRYFDGSTYVDDITPLDALLVINDLNANGVHTLPLDRPRPLTAPFLDVSRDGQVTPFDAVLVINFLNGGEGEGERAVPVARADQTAAWWPSADTATNVQAAPSPSTKDRPRASRTDGARESANFLQTLDLLYAKLDEALSATAGESVADRMDRPGGDLEKSLDSLLCDVADELSPLFPPQASETSTASATPCSIPSARS